MSHYSQGQCSLSCPDATAAAIRELMDPLGELGIEVEVHAIPQNLYGYHGDMRPEKANVILRRKHISASANDVGFLFENGKATAIISEYDGRSGHFDADWMKKVTQLQAVHKAMAVLKKQGRRFERKFIPRTGYGDKHVLRVYG